MGTVNRMNLDGELAPRCESKHTVLRDELRKLAEYIAQELPTNLFIYKGGLFLGEWTKHPRYTCDIDMSILELSSYDRLKHIFAEYGERLIERGVATSYDIVDDVLSDRSGGVKYRNGQEVVLSVDVAINVDSFDHVMTYVDQIGTVNISTVEQILSDKISVLYSKKRFRRVKDLFDVASIVDNCDVNYDKLIERLGAHGVWPLDNKLYPFTEERLVQLEHAF